MNVTKKRTTKIYLRLQTKVLQFGEQENEVVVVRSTTKTNLKRIIIKQQRKESHMNLCKFENFPRSKVVFVLFFFMKLTNLFSF